jgi:hypothetical protein
MYFLASEEGNTLGNHKVSTILERNYRLIISIIEFHTKETNGKSIQN